MRSRWLPVVAGLLLVSACSDTETPTAPVAAPAASDANTLSPSGCPSTLQLRTQLTNLYVQPGQIIIVNLKFTGIELAVLARKTKLAQDLMFFLVDYTLDRYRKNELRGKQSADTQAKLIALIKGLYCFVGLPEPNLSSLSLGPDGAAEVVQPSNTETTTVVTDTKFAGVTIPPGAINTATLITITRLPDFPGPLNTQLDQYPAFYQYTSSSSENFTTDVVVGTCQVADFTPPDYNRLVIGHNVGTGIELLPRVPAPFLDCSQLLSMGDPANGWFQYVSRGMRPFQQVAAKLLLPQKAYAASVLGTCCLGGSSKSFSPFGAVDPLTQAGAISPSSFVSLAGTAVASSLLPSIKVVTPQGRPVSGLSVNFGLTPGSDGSISGAVQTTNADGVATLGGWTVGAGNATVTATVTPLTGSSVANNPVSFTAEVVGQTVIPYVATGYRYLVIGSAAPPSGFEQPGFTGESSWPTGNAAFGSGVGSPDNCSLDNTVQTSWTAAAQTNSATSDLLVRKSFKIPNGWTAGAKVRVAIDNDVQVFVNGVDITASAGTASLVNGFQKHEGCAARGSLTFTVPSTALVAGGNNVVAVRARDRGRTSYFDMEVKLGE